MMFFINLAGEWVNLALIRRCRLNGDRIVLVYGPNDEQELTGPQSVELAAYFLSCQQAAEAEAEG